MITGVGAITSLGVGAQALHERWLAGRSGIEHGEGTCAEFEPTEFMSAKEMRRSDRFVQLAIAAGALALADASWSKDVPPTLGHELSDEGLDLDYPDGPCPLPGDSRPVAISSSFGFGGHNAVLCLGGAS